MKNKKYNKATISINKRLHDKAKKWCKKQMPQTDFSKETAKLWIKNLEL